MVDGGLHSCVRPCNSPVDRLSFCLRGYITVLARALYVTVRDWNDVLTCYFYFTCEAAGRKVSGSYLGANIQYMVLGGLYRPIGAVT